MTMTRPVGKGKREKPDAITTPKKSSKTSVLKARIKNADHSADALRKPLLLISVGGESHEKEYLEKTVKMLNFYGSEFEKRIDILVAGTLQRHNFWLFCHELSESTLIHFMQSLPDDTNEETLALKIAGLMYQPAHAAESRYIHDNAETYMNLATPFYILRWAYRVPVPESAYDEQVKRSSKYGNYLAHFNELKIKLQENAKLRDALDKTAFDHINKPAKLEPIKVEANRLANAALTAGKPRLASLLRKDNGVSFAKTCSRNYLIEECPLLFPELNAQGYTSIFYPGPITEALKAVKKEFNCDLEWLNIYHQKVDPEKKGQTIRDLGIPSENFEMPHHSLFARRFTASSAPLKRLAKPTDYVSTSPKSDPTHKKLSSVSTVSMDNLCLHHGDDLPNTALTVSHSDDDMTPLSNNSQHEALAIMTGLSVKTEDATPTMPTASSPLSGRGFLKVNTTTPFKDRFHGDSAYDPHTASTEVSSGVSSINSPMTGSSQSSQDSLLTACQQLSPLTSVKPLFGLSTFDVNQHDYSSEPESQAEHTGKNPLRYSKAATDSTDTTLVLVDDEGENERPKASPPVMIPLLNRSTSANSKLESAAPVSFSAPTQTFIHQWGASSLLHSSPIQARRKTIFPLSDSSSTVSELDAIAAVVESNTFLTINTQLNGAPVPQTKPRFGA